MMNTSKIQTIVTSTEKKYEISSLPLILEDLRIENVTWFIETSEQVLFFFIIKKDMIVTLLCKILINLM